VRTWRPDGAVVGEVDLGAHILDVVALPFDPAGAPSQVKVAAALETSNASEETTQP